MRGATGIKPAGAPSLPRPATSRPPVRAAGAAPAPGTGRQSLFGSFRETGYHLAWHDFVAEREPDWTQGLAGDCIVLCLNLEGEGYVAAGKARLDFRPYTVGFFRRKTTRWKGARAAGQRHRYLTVEYSGGFLAQHLRGVRTLLHPLVHAAVTGRGRGGVAGPLIPLTTGLHETIAALRRPPVYAAAQPLWYQCKVLELAVTFLFQPPPEEELFCTRQHRLAQERVERVIRVLKERLAEPPSLEELGRQIGCSPFYLSRIFSTHTGQTITQYLRRLRLERAAELLRSGRYNVTEAALAVGYSSLSHFSLAFYEAFGCCPGLYPLRTPTQQTAPGRSPGV